MDETRYHDLADAAFRTLEAMLDEVDTEVVDVDRAGDVLTLTFASGAKAVINTQRPTRQIWLAANARAWHFSWDEPSARWLDDKGQGIELVSHVASIVEAAAGVPLTRK